MDSQDGASPPLNEGAAVREAQTETPDESHAWRTGPHDGVVPGPGPYWQWPAVTPRTRLEGRWAAPLVALVVLVGVLAGGGRLLYLHLSGPATSIPPAAIGRAASPVLLREVTNISSAELAAVGPGSDAEGVPRIDPLAQVSRSIPISHGKPTVLYIGGEFCPYCAAERWSLVNALSRFGAFSGLRYMRSAEDDGDIATFTFHGSTYSSPYVDFQMPEIADRARRNLQSLTDTQELAYEIFGNGGVPFLDIDERYILNSLSAGFPTTQDAESLMGMDWGQIAGALQDPHNPIAGGILGNANYIAAAICEQTGNRPASACATPTIRQLEMQLRRAPHAG